MEDFFNSLLGQQLIARDMREPAQGALSAGGYTPWTMIQWAIMAS